jgi:hypothetical protein
METRMNAIVAPEPVRRIKTSLPEEYRGVGKSNEPVATFLGLFSIGLGLWELTAPRSVCRATGVRFSPRLIQAFGLREIMAGLGIMSDHQPRGWLWARVAGDANDLATLGTAYAEADNANDRQKVLMSMAAVAGVTAMDLLCAREHTHHPA